MPLSPGSTRSVMAYLFLYKDKQIKHITLRSGAFNSELWSGNPRLSSCKAIRRRELGTTLSSKLLIGGNFAALIWLKFVSFIVIFRFAQFFFFLLHLSVLGVISFGQFNPFSVIYVLLLDQRSFVHALNLSSNKSVIIP